ncbi:hypothetical protein C4577_02745 [Candidatus Parcubacteria bacterium]|nr:MAG: hypothetical protein C4577_02745 [Candidatus Parcubacteria bacterium]
MPSIKERSPFEEGPDILKDVRDINSGELPGLSGDVFDSDESGTSLIEGDVPDQREKGEEGKDTSKAA